MPDHVIVPPATMLYLTRRFTFSAGHRLHSPLLPPGGEEQAYGMCTRIHGHNYRLEVTVAGVPDPATGFFANVLDLSAVVQERIVDPCEHRMLDELPLFQGRPTTMENLCAGIWKEISGPLRDRGMTLHEVLLAETDDHWVRLRSDAVPSGRP